MARIVLAFYNGIVSKSDPSALPCFYESFIDGLKKAGNEVAVYTQPYFGLFEYPSIDEFPDIKQGILDFKPDVCIVFNYSFPDISDLVDCPIIIFEVDSARYYGNLQVLRKKKDRFLYFVSAQSSRAEIKRLFGVDDKYIFIIPFFTEVRAGEPSAFEPVNISFIGTNFYNIVKSWYETFLELGPNEEFYRYFKVLYEWIRKHPTEDINIFWKAVEGTLFYECRKILIQNGILHNLSAEQRGLVLGIVEPLGLRIYGTENWRNTYYGNVALNMAYDPTEIYSLRHNQDVYNSSKIGISVSHVQAVDGFPWRIMDIMASDACLVTDYHGGFVTAFPEVAEYLPVYDNPGDAYILCKTLLNDEPLRQDVVARCQEVIEKRYRFKHCLKRMEEALGMELHK